MRKIGLGKSVDRGTTRRNLVTLREVFNGSIDQEIAQYHVFVTVGMAIRASLTLSSVMSELIYELYCTFTPSR